MNPLNENPTLAGVGESSRQIFFINYFVRLINYEYTM